jgi:antitoxin (DNA-binding transcriptional repressor) of toxin-antitoxin stability system
MKTLNCTGETSCDDVVRTAAGEDVVLLRDGRAVALVIPFDDDDLEWYARERDPAFLASIVRARQQVRQGQTVSLEQLRRELGLN